MLDDVIHLPWSWERYLVWGCWRREWYTLDTVSAGSLSEAEQLARHLHPDARLLHVVPLSEAA
jgi:hypothetical protein